MIAPLSALNIASDGLPSALTSGANRICTVISISASAMIWT